MSPTAQINALAQSVYLRIKNRQYDGITTTDGQAFVANIIDFANGFIDELETEINPDGQAIDWKWSELLGTTLGTATAGASSISFSNSFNNLIAEEQRFVQILQDGTPVANFVVVSPNDITSVTRRSTQDMVTITGNTINGRILTFSRPFTEAEDGGTIIGDVTAPIPKLSLTNVQALTMIKPRELLVLGIAKNASLPDIVQGSLSPSFVQKYNDLLANTIARNLSGGAADSVARDSYTYIGGVGF